MDLGVKYIVEIDTQTSAIPGLVGMEREVTSLESTILGLKNDVMGLGYALGITFATRQVYDFGKEIVNTQAKLEGFRNLINFSSKDVVDAGKNQAEILKTITDYRLPIMETYDQYSRFLGAIKGTPIEGEKARQTFDDLAKTLAVMHLPAERTGRALYAVQEMFAEGRVQTRHFLRQLAIALPGIDAEAAKVMGVSIAQFNEMLTKKAGHGQINAYEFLPKLFRELAKDWGQNLPTALHSTQAELIDLNNQWIEFKDDIGTKLKPELVSLFKTLKDGITWMKTHEADLISWGKLIIKVGEYYVGYRIAVTALNTVQGLWAALSTSQVSKLTTETIAVNSQTAAVNALTASIERLNFVQNATNASFIATAEGTVLANTVGNRYVATATSGAAGAEAGVLAGGAAAAGTSLATTVAGVLAAAVVVIAAIKLKEHLEGSTPEGRKAKAEADRYWGNNFAGRYNFKQVTDSSHYGLAMDPWGKDKNNPLNTDPNKKIRIYDKKWTVDSTNHENLPQWQIDLNKKLTGNSANLKPLGSNAPGSKGSDEKHYNPASDVDKVTGQKVITYNVRIERMIGINEVHTNTARENIQDVAAQIQAHLLSVTKDSQLGGND